MSIMAIARDIEHTITLAKHQGYINEWEAHRLKKMLNDDGWEGIVRATKELKSLMLDIRNTEEV